MTWTKNIKQLMWKSYNRRFKCVDKTIGISNDKLQGKSDSNKIFWEKLPELGIWHHLTRCGGLKERPFPRFIITILHCPHTLSVLNLTHLRNRKTLHYIGSITFGENICELRAIEDKHFWHCLNSSFRDETKEKGENTTKTGLNIKFNILNDCEISCYGKTG